MSSNDRKRGIATKFYPQDVVVQDKPPHSVGVIVRSRNDPEEFSVAESLPDSFMRSLQQGEVGVSFVKGPNADREIVNESELRLLNRGFRPGDFCKRSVEDVRAGIITDIHIQGRVAHAITGEPSEDWKTPEDMQSRVYAEVGDYVVYEDWIGQVIEIYDEAVIERSNGQLLRLPELGSRLCVGEKASDILPPSSSATDLLAYMRARHQSEVDGTVVAVNHLVYAVSWLAINQFLYPSEANEKSRPLRFWAGDDLAKLTLVLGKHDIEFQLGERVELKDGLNASTTIHGGTKESEPILENRTHVITEVQTIIDILWQDGQRESLKSVDVVPYLNPDEYDCWPGDHVLFRSEGTKRPAVVQSVNASDRTAIIRFPDTNSAELVSVLELDCYGGLDSTPDQLQFNLLSTRVHRGDFVLLYPEGTTSGFSMPTIPQLGELELWVKEPPLPFGDLPNWRKEFSDIGNSLACVIGNNYLDKARAWHPSIDATALRWLGEVTDLRLDGTVEVTHSDKTVGIYPLNRIAKLCDSIDQLEENSWGDGTSAGDEMNEMQMPYSDDERSWHSHDAEWADTHNYDIDVDVEMQDAVDEALNEDFDMGQSHLEGAPSLDGQMGVLLATHDGALNSTNDSEQQPEWKHFEILPRAPDDHAFISSTPVQPSKPFMSRLSKEYRALSSSLPESILVRTYEDRADLLRCLILGPTNTPYEDAPFVIDWMLESTFPQTPPLAHFHSWTNGNGRVNPNLYEEGKVCLSILGTWAGDKNEIWNAARSSLLQAFVSIQGLVLVKEPWYCEPAYEKLRGTEEGIVNSRLYNEKAYVLSRGFILRALEIPVGGLEEEVQLLYYGHHRLEKALHDAHVLIEQSRAGTQTSSTEESDRAVPCLTAGGIIMLERTLDKLQSRVFLASGKH